MSVRVLFFVLVAAGVIYFFGDRLTKWVKSIAKAVDRKENEKFKKFDTKLNPPENKPVVKKKRSK